MKYTLNFQEYFMERISNHWTSDSIHMHSFVQVSRDKTWKKLCGDLTHVNILSLASMHLWMELQVIKRWLEILIAEL